MQYLVSVIDDGQAAAAGDNYSATPAEDVAIDAFNERLKADGHWLFAGGRGAPDSATTVDNRSTRPIITDGPFVESKEFMAGFWIIDARDSDVALVLATNASKACNRRIEVRPFHHA